MMTVKKNELQIRPGLTPLLDHEAKIYFSSKWYRDQIKARRHGLIASGFIVYADEHPNNPVRRVIVKPNTLH